MSRAHRSRGAQRRNRAVGIVATITVAGLALAGCGTVPGAAVEVDGVRIDEQVVQQRTDAVIAENIPDSVVVDNATRAMLNRYQATDLVRHQLAQDAADAESIDVTDEKINSFIAQNGGAASIAQALNAPVAAVHDAAYDYMVLSDLVSKIPAEGVEVTNVTVTVDAVLASDRAEAVADRAKYLKDPGSMKADAQAAAQSQQAPAGDYSLLTSSELALTGLYTAPEGEIVLYPQQGGQYLVMRVTKRTEAPATLTQDTVSQAQSLDGYMVVSSLLLRQYAADQDISVNPRFGEWDSKTLQVIPAHSGL